MWASDGLGAVRDRIQADLATGQDVVITSYVGLWIRHQHDPNHNLYWGDAYGHSTLFERKSSVHQRLPSVGTIDYTIIAERDADHDPIAVKVLRATVPSSLSSGKATGHLVIVTLAYADMQRAVYDMGMQLKTGRIPKELNDDPTLGPLLRRSYVMGYWGHNVYYAGDIVDQLERVEVTTGDTPRGVFVVACQSARWFPQKFLSDGIEPILFTTTNMAPEAYIAFALYDGLVRGLSARELRGHVARAYQEYQGLAKPPLSLFVTDAEGVAQHTAPLSR